MQFADFACAHGLVTDTIHPAERIKRCGTETHPRSLNGAYWYDGERGWIYNWEHSTAVVWWNNPDAKPWTQDDKDAWRRRQAANESARNKQQLLIGTQVEAQLADAELLNHSYLQYKGFPDEVGFVIGVELWVPMRDFFTGKMLGAQRIKWLGDEVRYEKKMTAGMRAKGAVYWIGDKAAPEVFLCEGYATGLSIYAAIKSIGLRAAVLVCFSAHNMVHVAKHIKAKAYVVADNDKSGVGEAAAKSTGLAYCMSDHAGFDANDHHIKRGLMKLVGMMMAVRLAK